MPKMAPTERVRGLLFKRASEILLDKAAVAEHRDTAKFEEFLQAAADAEEGKLLPRHLAAEFNARITSDVFGWQADAEVRREVLAILCGQED